MLERSIKTLGMVTFPFVGLLVFLIVGAFNPAVAQTGLQLFEDTETKSSETRASKPKIKRSSLSRNLQVELNRLGCNAGRLDGQWGRGSQRALDRLVKKQPALKGVKRSPALLEQIKSLQNGGCATVSASKSGNDPDKPGNAIGQTGVERFDGKWRLDVDLGDLCNYRKTSLAILIENGKISAVEHKMLRGTVNGDGKVSMTGRPKTSWNIEAQLSGTMGEQKGKGRLRDPTGYCNRGKFKMSRW